MGILSDLKKAIFGRDEPEPVSETRMNDDQATIPADARDNYAAALEAERAQKDAFFRSHPYSPLEHEARHHFRGLKYYEPNPDLRLRLALQPVEPGPITFQTSTGDEQTYFRVGKVQFEVDGRPAELTVYRSADHDELFLPFRDAESGRETYGGGRYLEPTDLGNGEVLLDFNLAYNPYCAYSPYYSCPLPPVENWLKVPIRAGEKNYEEH